MSENLPLLIILTCTSIFLLWLRTSVVSAVKGKFDRDLAMYKSLLPTTAIYQQTLDKRLLAIERLWKELRAMRKKVSVILFLERILPTADYQQVLEPGIHLKSKVTLAEAYNGSVWKSSEEHNLEDVRIYLGERLWAEFYLYRQFAFRIILLVEQSMERGQMSHWTEDDTLKVAVSKSFDKSEQAFVLGEPTGTIHRLFDLLDQRVLGEVEAIISGERSVVNNVEQARKLERLL
jgi:hypothetical protein